MSALTTCPLALGGEGGEPPVKAAAAGCALADWTPGHLAADATGRWKWLRLGGVFRARAEAPTSLNFATGHDDAEVLTRIRLNAEVKPRPWLKLMGEFQDVHAPGYNAPVPGSVSNEADLRQAYVELGSSESRGVSMRAGRQALKFGQGRLVWDPDWGNFGRTFDALRVTAAGNGVRLDLFAASVVAPQDHRFDRSRHDNMFYGAYGTLARWGKLVKVEPYLFLKSAAGQRDELGRTGALDLYSIGLRVTGAVTAAVNWESDVVMQTGRLGVGPVRAYGGAWQVGWRSGERKAHPLLTAAYSYASGDDRPGDGERGTFDTLYPTVHLRNGATDRIGWANLHDGSLSGEWTLSKKWKVSASGHDFHLASMRDALYSPGGVALVRNRAAGSSHVGFELAGWALYAISKSFSFGAGYAHLFRGEYLRQSHCGGASQPYVYLDYRY